VKTDCHWRLLAAGLTAPVGIRPHPRRPDRRSQVGIIRVARDDSELTHGGPVRSRRAARSSDDRSRISWATIGSSVSIIAAPPCEARQSARAGRSGYSFGNDLVPGGGRPGLLELVVEPEIAGGSRQKIGQPLHAADRLMFAVAAGGGSRVAARFRARSTPLAVAVGSPVPIGRRMGPLNSRPPRSARRLRRRDHPPRPSFAAQIGVDVVRDPWS
jgi:hypothetical protein